MNDKGNNSHPPGFDEMKEKLEKEREHVTDGEVYMKLGKKKIKEREKK